MFSNFSKIIEEGNERWKKINELAIEIDTHLNDKHNVNTISTNKLAELLLLVVEHLRPMNVSQDPIDEFTKGIADLLGSFKK